MARNLLVNYKFKTFWKSHEISRKSAGSAMALLTRATIANVLLDFSKTKFNIIRLTHIASIDSGIFTELRGGGFDAVFVHIRQENTCTVFSDCLRTRKANALRALGRISASPSYSQPFRFLNRSLNLNGPFKP